ncbi:DUF5324 family protein [Streptantibioticus rubrisoli]|uniref:DUF5324 family protein n=1 Tax=Streptantibioticus rubrisoli TaxID=1387313 RepID=A0ABT1P9X2_9ACTN|nr:DUF5324 family protein [Streptantibioticus rubrisoli]MCQ4042169.1 DUF5324 family protein [Streptantibioticus rubrisoli]
MTRKNSVRNAAVATKESVQHAAEVVAPYAGTARDTAVQYADEARRRLAPKVSSAANYAALQARTQYDAHLQPRIAQAIEAVPPGVSATATKASRKTRKAARKTRKAARKAAGYAAPRVGQAAQAARAAAEPVRQEATARSAAALAALRGGVSAADIEKLARRRSRRCRVGRIAKLLAALGVLGGGTFAAVRWWKRQTSPEWLVEPPSPTEVPDTGRAPLHAVDTDAADAAGEEKRSKDKGAG